jgi:hypothetical protein
MAFHAGTALVLQDFPHHRLFRCTLVRGSQCLAELLEDVEDVRLTIEPAEGQELLRARFSDLQNVCADEKVRMLSHVGSGRAIQS